MAKSAVSAAKVSKLHKGQLEEKADLLSTEEPLEIRLHFYQNAQLIKKTISVTMRTPGHDFELAIGFLFTEGIITDYAQVEHVRFCEEADTADALENIVIVTLRRDAKPSIEKLERNFYTTSSCGVCGKASMEAVEVCKAELKISSSQKWSADALLALPIMMREQQTLFGHTGSIHASALYNHELKLIALREDVGRHNALDKLAGVVFAKPAIDTANCVLVLSGRISFELVQKAAMMGIGTICAVGAPSSLAVESARKWGITLTGFLKKQGFNIYCHHEKILHENQNQGQ